MLNVQQDFRDALKVILAEMPKHDRRVSRSATISFARIAREAKHSRTLISKNECAYPELRALILRVQRRVKSCRSKTVASPDEAGGETIQGQTLVEANARLRKRVKELTREVQMFATLLAEADQQLRIYERGDARAEHDRERRAKRNRIRQTG